MKHAEFFKLKELTSEELKTYSGGNPVLWLVGGYIFGEVMQGIYQAQQNGCFSR